MRDSRTLKTWRDLWQHRARSLLVVLAVALGLTAAGTVLNAWAAPCAPRWARPSPRNAGSC